MDRALIWDVKATHLSHHPSNPQVYLLQALSTLSLSVA